MPARVEVIIDPPDVEEEDLEDFLATDDLFVEYFNYFLSLPTFPEALCFNRETGGFEVVSSAKKELAQQIKAAVRASKRPPPIYQVTTCHAFSDIPLIPMEEDCGPEKQMTEIDTSFTVQTLNKEQGVEWVKRRRLPAFLRSDCYLEYRLAKVLSATRIEDDNGERTVLNVSYQRRPRKRRKRELTPPPKIDEKEVMIKSMYVCMGEAGTTETESWYSVAKMALHTEVTHSSSSLQHQPTSTSIQTNTERDRRPFSSRPVSARPPSSQSTRSIPDSRHVDSGIGSPTKSSLFGDSTSYTGGSALSVEHHQAASENEIDITTSQLFAATPAARPTTPRPSDIACVLAENLGSSGVVFYGNTDTKTATSGDAKLGTPITENRVIDIEFNNIEELSSVIAASTIKKAAADILHIDPLELGQWKSIQSLYPDSKYQNVSFDSLDAICLVETAKTLKTPELPKNDPNVSKDSRKELSNQKQSESTKIKDSGYESDGDSLLTSDDDDGPNKKAKGVSLRKRKDIEDYKVFLEGTRGQQNWLMWLDIDKGRLLEQKEVVGYLAAMRERYHQQGAPLQLSREVKLSLGLTEPGQWTMDKLLSVQTDLIEPLVLYWSPRFLMSGQKASSTSDNLLYKHQKLMQSAGTSYVYPDPPTKSLLPLRPKSCVPRIAKPSPAVSPVQVNSQVIVPTPLPPTTPLVGQRRTYNIPIAFSKYIHGCKKVDNLLQNELTPSSKMKSLETSIGEMPFPHPPSSPRSSSRPQSSHVRPVSWDTESTTSETLTKNIRAKSAMIRRSSDCSGSSASSVFVGGRRMEGLLQALHSENKAGKFFQTHIQNSNNKLWKNCICLWQDLQDYHNLFYVEVLDGFRFEKKAQFINSQYIVEGSVRDIGCSCDIRTAINRCIEPPYEDLFDPAEEYSLSVLYVAWIHMKSSDQTTYGKVELVEVKRRLETKSRYVVNLRRRGLIRQASLESDCPDILDQDPVYDPAILENIPEEFKEFTLDKLIHNRLELEAFRQYLAENYASLDLTCWMDIEAFRRLGHEDATRRDAKAKEIKLKYLNKKYFFGPNSPAGKDGQGQVMELVGGWGKLLDDRPANEMLLEVQKYVQRRLDNKWFPLFVSSPEFAERQRPQSSMGDVAEDIVMQRKRKSQAVFKMLESKWVSSSKEIMCFRKALLNPITSQQFMKFVSLRGDCLENDVLFWKEVQKYKDLHHCHADEPLVQQKVSTILNCFIDSQIPPSLQIDICQEDAERLLERRRELGPYLFREAQLTVFRMLFPHWSDFCIYRSKVASDRLLPALERQRRRARAKDLQQAKELQEQRNKEIARRRALGLPLDGLINHDDPRVDHLLDYQDEDDPITEMNQNQDRVSWSYAKYIDALQRETVLNNTDEGTFSSLRSNTGSEEDIDRILGTKPEDGHSRRKEGRNSLTSKNIAKASGGHRSSVNQSISVHDQAKTTEAPPQPTGKSSSLKSGQFTKQTDKKASKKLTINESSNIIKRSAVSRGASRASGQHTRRGNAIS